MIKLSEYKLERLRQDGEFVLYRGLRESQSEASPLSILVLAPAVERPAPGSLRRVDHELSLKEDLDPAWAARPLARAQHEGRSMLLLEDPGGVPLDLLLAGPMELGQVLSVAIGLSAALSQLHGRGLIHKDIKPSNVLVNLATGQAWLMGFGAASHLQRERQSPEPPECIAGTLPYMAPEQTGRMSRSIDSRSDLYSLGVTLYEMLTGVLPFTASDSMELVHCHVARQPVPPSQRTPDLPSAVSDIVMKLLAKAAEDRYQTAVGVERDLRRCLAEWEAGGRIGEFPLGEQDTPDRLLIPEKLYGREREIEALLASIDRVVSSGAPELVLVSGYSGIGKSSVVNELQKVLVPPRGLFAAGKFDQYKRDIPYATLAQAFQSLVRSLLGKSEEELGCWRDGLREALRPNGQLMVDLVPELRLIIGEQAPVPELPPQDAQRRFQLVFLRLLGVFARPEHPLALFLDDLQWLDAATLDLLEHLMTQTDVRHFLLIGAYRDNEVTPAHPLMRKIEAIRDAGAPVQEIVLAPLAEEDLGQLIADSLHCERERAAPLAQLVHEKTAGNPFFAIQFLSALVEEGLLTFDHGAARWLWDPARIHVKGYTDNVVDLMAGKLSRLPVDTQKALRQLACLGNGAEFSLLEKVYEDSKEELHGDLQDAVRTGLVLHSDGAYTFLHDRVQEAAYSLIPEAERAEAHLRIGRLLAAHTTPEKRDEAIFEIVNQLNRGAALITSRDEREQLAEFNLIAGRRAQSSAAYVSALTYLLAGRGLLGDDSWDHHYELVYGLEFHLAECEFLTGNMTAADDRLSRLACQARLAEHVVAVVRLRITLYTALDRSDRAVEVCLEYLERTGTHWTPRPTSQEVQREYDRIWSQLGNRPIEALVDLPPMTDSNALAALDVLTEVGPAALYTDENLFSLVICRMINLVLEHGNSGGSCFAYVALGVIAGPRFDDYQAGFRFGRLGYDLVEKGGWQRFQPRVYMIFGCFVMPWTRHIRTARQLLRRAFDAANRIGDVTFAAFSCCHLGANLLAAGDPLAEAQREAEHGLEFAQKARFGFVGHIMRAQLGLIRTLRGLSPKFGSFDGTFDELEFERQVSGVPAFAQTECLYWIRKLQARLFAEDYPAAIHASERARRALWTLPSSVEGGEYQFYSALAHAASCDAKADNERQQHVEALVEHHRGLEIWAANCPENFENRAALVGAEIARIEGRVLDAELLYEKAIRSARENAFVHNEALSNELAGRFYGARGFETISHAYLRHARYGYLRWGAQGKVRHLDQLYPYLSTAEEASAALTDTIRAPVEHLDLATVIKVSQTISGEIVFEKLLDTLMRTAIEHAGAERALLILSREAEQRIAAEATTRRDTVVVHLCDEPVTGAALPEAVLRYVLHTQESVILDDAANQNTFSADPYIGQRQTRSVLCLPLLSQGKLIGVLYLENNLAARVFAPARVAVLKLLASQAASSLDNSRLYRDLAEREAEIRRLVDSNIIGIFIWNFDGRILDANDAFLSMVGYDRADLDAGRLRWTDMTPPDWRERDARIMQEHKKTGRAEPFEKEYLRKDGSRVPVLLGAATFKENADEGVAFVLDLTERKRAEEKFRLAVESSPSAMVMTNEAGNIVLINSQVERLFGYTREELIGRPVEVLVPERFRGAHPEYRRGFSASAQVRAMGAGQELFALRKDGTEVPIEIGLNPIQTEKGRLVLSSILDITARKLAEEELRQAQATQFEISLETRVRERTRIARELHDTLLQNFQGLLLRFQSVLKILPERPLEARRRLHSALDQAAAAITDARDAIQGLRFLAAETGDLARAITAVGEELKAQRRDPDAPVLLVEVEGAPRPLNPVVRDEAYRIAVEALRNAFRHARARHIAVEIRYGEGQFRLRVRDDGKGLDEQDVERAAAAGHFGLAGMRERAESVGGRLEARSRIDSGTEVELSIPAAIAYGEKAQRSWLTKGLYGHRRDDGRTEP